ncbi:hypothetical protein JCM10213v2_002320 [Rhodosporidiobolus nylandii]
MPPTRSSGARSPLNISQSGAVVPSPRSSRKASRGTFELEQGVEAESESAPASKPQRKRNAVAVGANLPFLFFLAQLTVLCQSSLYQLQEVRQEM